MDPYNTLGVDRNSTQEDIKKAYRKLAAQHHPDRGGDTKRFQEIQGAYDTLCDPNRRAQFDNPPSNHEMHFNFGNMNDIFNMFNMRGAGSARQLYNFSIQLTLEQILHDSVQTLQINSNQGQKYVQINVPRGVESGQMYRYDELLENVSIQITFFVNQHSKFNRNGLDLYSTVTVNVFDLILGTTLNFVTVHGKELEIKLSKLSKSDHQLRLPGHGLSNAQAVGDQYILIKAEIPDTISNELLIAIEQEKLRRKV
jgi:DnaJ-class molecular chaperone